MCIYIYISLSLSLALSHSRSVSLPLSTCLCLPLSLTPCLPQKTQEETKWRTCSSRQAARHVKCHCEVNFILGRSTFYNHVDSLRMSAELNPLTLNNIFWHTSFQTRSLSLTLSPPPFALHIHIRMYTFLQYAYMSTYVGTGTRKNTGTMAGDMQMIYPSHVFTFPYHLMAVLTNAKLS